MQASGFLALQRARAKWRDETIKDVLGNTAGLKPNQVRRITKLYTRRISPHQIVTPEFARQLAELSHETRRQIGALIDRNGHIEYVIVGDNRRIELPDFKRIRVAVDRFRGLRFVHTHLRGEGLTQDDLADLRSEEHTSELQSQSNLVCRLLLEKKKKKKRKNTLNTKTQQTIYRETTEL